MTDYDNAYYFIRMDDTREYLPYLRPDTDTNARRFRNTAPAPGASPLVFTNALKDDFRTAGVRAEIPDILFESSNVVVRDHIRAQLLEHEIPGMFLHPAVYIDDDGERHEDYWFLGFTSRFDCWDRDKSTYASPPLQLGANAFHDVHTYSLDSKLLDATPLENRLLFQMGGTQDAMIVCHQRLARVFRGDEQSGALLQPVSDY